MPKVFLCHSSQDKPFARKLNTSLQAFGIATWLDEAELLPGDSLIGRIEEGLSASDYLVVILTPNSVKSEWCKRELRSALTFEVSGEALKVIPVIAATCDVPPFLIDKYYVDFTGDYTDALTRILGAFLTHEELTDIKPELVRKWNSRFRSSGLDEFKAFVTRELEAQQRHNDLQEFLRSASRETVTRLLELNVEPVSKATIGDGLVLVAGAYGCIEQCRNCGTPIIDRRGLAAKLKSGHNLKLSVTEVCNYLERFPYDGNKWIDTEECDVCHYYNNQGAD